MTAIDRVLRRSVRDEMEAVGFVPTASKLYRPAPGLVPRSELVQRVRSRGGDVVMVTAPAGFGKSTFLAELTGADPRPTAWVSLTASENEPAELLTYVALALDEIEPVDPGVVAALWRLSPTIGSPAVEHFGAMLAARQVPFVLVLDDVHELVGRDALDALTVLVAELPPGSTIVLGARRAIPLPLGRLRVRRRLVEVATAELAFDEHETATFLRLLEVDAGPDELARLVERTEGWPVALYLAALAQGARRSVGEIVDEFAGDQQFIVEYLGEEVLGGLDADVASFLMEASCFDRLSGRLCDEVLQRQGSPELLERLQRQNLLVIALDDRREWYRFHHLMTEFLQTELARRHPDRRRVIHERASAWCDAHGDGDGAVIHALLAGDHDRAEAMVLRWFGTVATAARPHSGAARWVAMFSDDAMAGRPQLMAVAALASFSSGDPGVALQWLARADSGLTDRYPDDVFGLVGPVAAAVARAIMAPLSPAELATESQYAYEHVGLGDGHPAACMTRGAAAFMVGNDDAARRWLREGADTTLDRPLIVANCLAHLAVVDAEHERWEEAAIGARRARALLREGAALPSSALVLAMSTLVETHAGRPAAAAADQARCRQHLTRLVGVAPWLNLQARVALARAAVLRHDRVEAAALVEEALMILELVPGADRVAEQLAGLQREVAVRDRTQSFGPSSLTIAELRVLHLLPTHLSVADIAERLFVSRNTVKSQTISIYRKLGTSSRGGAVEIARTAGLLAASGRDD